MPDAAQSVNPYQMVPRGWLRILGIPAACVKVVQGAASLEAIEALDCLSDTLKMRLIELATHPTISVDSSQLIYRATLDQLTDYAAGKLRRLILNLTPDQQRFVDQALNGTGLLRGCAGSGKTSILIYRAKRLAMAGHRVLLVTYSRPLSQALMSYIEELVSTLPTLTVTTVNSWSATYLARYGKASTVAPNKDLDDALRTAIAETVADGFNTAALSFPFFRDEIAQVIKANALDSKTAYLDWQRYGRGRALQPSQRALVWEVYTRYERVLAEKGLFDWADQTLLTLRMLSEQSLAEPFDYVLVDEAQDLTGAQFRLLQKIVRCDEQGPALFLVGDESQTIYTRGFTWQQIGFSMRGHSFTIRKNFRGTRPIAEAATALLKHNKLFTHASEMVDPSASDSNGALPMLLLYSDRDHAQTVVCEQIFSLVEDGVFRLSDIAILCPIKDLVTGYASKLAVLNIPYIEVKSDTKVDMFEETVKVLTLHSAKGLEFPAVFITGLEQGTLPRVLSLTDPTERAFELEKQRLLLYVGLTCASEALYLATPSNETLQSQFIAELDGYYTCDN